MQATPLNELIDNWEKDSVIDSNNIEHEMLKIPRLHSKYATQIIAHTLAFRAKQFQYQAHRKLKWMYFNGKCSQEQLKEKNWEPFSLNLKMIKGDVNIFLEADAELQDMLAKMEIHERAIKFCEMIVKELNNRNFEIRGYMDFLKYSMGN